MRPTTFHWLILCSTSAMQMPLTKCDNEINKYKYVSKWPKKRAHNVPRTLWNVGLNDSLVNVPRTCQQRCKINIYASNKYLFHNIVSTLSQRYTMTQHLSNVV